MSSDHTPRRSRTYLEVPFEARTFAKNAGARWDNTRKSWYVLGEVPEMLMGFLGSDVRNGLLQQLDEADAKRGKAAPAKPRLRHPPEGDEQADLFVPTLFEVAAKDSISVMDVAVFRLSKRDKRRADIIRYELPDGLVEVSAGAYGMATVWDYDIVLMAISHLAEAVNRHRKMGSPMPTRTFRPHPSEILKFCRMSDGGRQYEAIEGAIDRLRTTVIKNVRTVKGHQRTAWAPESLIAEGSRTISDATTGRVTEVEIVIPTWVYDEVVKTEQPEILTMHRDYFLLDGGIARFLYRLARRAAGRTSAEWLFRTLYERSGSTGTLKEFSRALRTLIQSDELPEYTLAEVAGKGGPMLKMTYRGNAEDAPGRLSKAAT
ncbi:replication initiator protein A [Xanthomonas campestris]|uniref:replication initiator protein A n=1 Tax=Xanthomonas campestris TaxID=339 RepID=UPI0035583978